MPVKSDASMPSLVGHKKLLGVLLPRRGSSILWRFFFNSVFLLAGRMYCAQRAFRPPRDTEVFAGRKEGVSARGRFLREKKNSLP